MAGATKKPPMLAPKPVYALLDQLSKAALLDLAYDLIAQRCECADDPDPAELVQQIKTALVPVLAHRGDPMPKLLRGCEGWTRT